MDDRLLVLKEKDRHQQNERRHGNAFEHVVDLRRRLFAEDIDHKTDRDRHYHQHDILYQQIANRQLK